MSPWKLRGEPNQASAGRLAAGDRPSLLVTNAQNFLISAFVFTIYNIPPRKMQEGIFLLRQMGLFAEIPPGGTDCSIRAGRTERPADSRRWETSRQKLPQLRDGLGADAKHQLHALYAEIGAKSGRISGETEHPSPSERSVHPHRGSRTSRSGSGRCSPAAR